MMQSASIFAQSDQNLHWTHFGQPRLQSFCADAQADSNLRRAQMSEGTFSNVAVKQPF